MRFLIRPQNKKRIAVHWESTKGKKDVPDIRAQKKESERIDDAVWGEGRKKKGTTLTTQEKEKKGKVLA